MGSVASLPLKTISQPVARTPLRKGQREALFTRVCKAVATFFSMVGKQISSFGYSVKKCIYTCVGASSYLSPATHPDHLLYPGGQHPDLITGDSKELFEKKIEEQFEAMYAKVNGKFTNEQLKLLGQWLILLVEQHRFPLEKAERLFQKARGVQKDSLSIADLSYFVSNLLVAASSLEPGWGTAILKWWNLGASFSAARQIVANQELSLKQKIAVELPHFLFGLSYLLPVNNITATAMRSIFQLRQACMIGKRMVEGYQDSKKTLTLANLVRLANTAFACKGISDQVKEFERVDLSGPGCLEQTGPFSEVIACVEKTGNDPKTDLHYPQNAGYILSMPPAEYPNCAFSNKIPSRLEELCKAMDAQPTPLSERAMDILSKSSVTLGCLNFWKKPDVCNLMRSAAPTIVV